jgi:membrane protein YdbS with pleckstrin-like domain
MSNSGGQFDPRSQPAAGIAGSTEAAANLASAGAGTADAPHRPADDTEEVYFDGSPRARGEMMHLLGHFVIGIALIAVPFIWAALQKDHAWPIWWVTLTLVLLGILFGVMPIVRVRTMRYRITNYRIDFERGWLGKTIDTLELWHVEDIRYHQTFLDRLLNVGTITVVSHDESLPRLELKGLPNPRPLFETLKQRVIAVKRQRGVIKMDPG